MDSLTDGSLEHAHQRDVRPWLDLIDELRSHGISQDIPLPQIAVMGDQSCGKSSVLEAISGVPFPRGSGLVTRCATQLIMKAAPEGGEWTAHATVTGPRQDYKGCGKVVGGPDALTGVISDLQNALTGGNPTAFSRESIVVEVIAPGLPDLTLIDLPGIVRTTTSGQSSTVMSEVNSLMEHYLSQKRTIILAVVPSNQDIATVDILERAKRVDPEGERTIGVLTKPDLIGPGNEDEVIAVLKNIRKPLKLGYVAVKCRSQKDINGKMSNSEALAAEAKFFRDHAVLSTLPGNTFGIPNLTTRLADLLVRRIGAALPGIKWEIQNQLGKVESQLAPMLKGVPQDSTACHSCLMRVVSDYCRLLRQSARGFYRDDVLSARVDLRLHAITQSIFRGLHRDIADTMPGFNDPGFGERLSEEMRALKGRELPGFLNHQVFYGFMVQNVETWRGAVETCRTSVANATIEVASLLIEALSVQFPRLSTTIRDTLSNIVEELADSVSTRIDAIFQKESDPFTTNEGMLEVINTIRYRNFDAAVAAALAAAGDKPGDISVMATAVKTFLGDWYMNNHGVGTMANVDDMCTLLQAYWTVATKRMVDNVCMTLEQDFIVQLLGDAERELFLISAKVKNLEELFIEDPSVADKRRSLQGKRDRLTLGLDSLRRMAPDVIAEPPKEEGEGMGMHTVNGMTMTSWGGDMGDGHGGGLTAAAAFTEREQRNQLLSSAEGRRANTDWSTGGWSSQSNSHSHEYSTTDSHSSGGGQRRGVQPDHYNLPVRPQTEKIAPQPPPRAAVSPAPPPAQNLSVVDGLVDMGFSRQNAIAALDRTGGDPNRAAELLMSQSQGPPVPSRAAQPPPAPLTTLPIPVLRPTPAPQILQPTQQQSARTQAQTAQSNVPPQAGGRQASPADPFGRIPGTGSTPLGQPPAGPTGQPSRVQQSRANYSALFGDEAKR